MVCCVGFYSLFILKADEIDHDKLMEFFPGIDKNKHMNSAFIIGYSGQSSGGVWGKGEIQKNHTSQGH